jgi:hypothetical protein
MTLRSGVVDEYPRANAVKVEKGDPYIADLETHWSLFEHEYGDPVAQVGFNENGSLLLTAYVKVRHWRGGGEGKNHTGEILHGVSYLLHPRDMWFLPVGAAIPQRHCSCRACGLNSLEESLHKTLIAWFEFNKQKPFESFVKLIKLARYCMRQVQGWENDAR